MERRHQNYDHAFLVSYIMCMNLSFYIIWMNLIFHGKKLFRIFRMIYNFAIAITRIHFAIYEVQSDNLKPDI